jgi:hypothetical protein
MRAIRTVAEASVAARTVALLVPLLVAVGACMETRHSLGDDCLKDGDCLSGVCTQLRCTASPPTTNFQVTLSPPAGDASSDGPKEATEDAMGADVGED